MNEIMKRFDELYAMMASSGDVKNMHLFGRVMREMMESISSTRPEQAMKMIEKLCAIKWTNYLTRDEAKQIVDGMTPRAIWSEEEVFRMLTNIGIDHVEEAPYYNEHALWVTISMKYSDSADSIKEIAGRQLDDTEILNACYRLALDVLKDEDGMFNIRKYFGLD